VAQVAIRRAEPADATVITELVSVLGYPAAVDETRDRMEQLEQDGQILFVAELNGELVGIAVLQIYPVLVQDAAICRLAVLVVAERMRRRGIGRALTLAVEEEARRSGCDRVVLDSAVWRDESHEFYRSCQYESSAHRFQKRL
jgi:N-acetylglutamate synthase-like GNAT family acetyltransferase